MFYSKPVFGPDQVTVDYDAILVAVLRQSVNAVYQTIKKARLPLEKVCFLTLPMDTAPDICAQENLSMARRLLSEENLLTADIYVGEGSPADFVQTDLKAYMLQNKRSSFRYLEEKKYFVYNDRNDTAGTVDHYFFQDLWAAKRIYQRNPKRHFDIGSRIDGFIGHLLTFRDQVTMIDIRPQPTQIEGVDFLCADATNLENVEDDSIESLSALCSLEHFGLGRYGDPIDPEACFKAFEAIQKKIRPGGFAYIAVPVGKEHLEFNAHRIFYAKTVVDAFDRLDLVEYSATDGSGITYNVSIHEYDDYYNGCGIFGLFCFQKRNEK